ncbi:MAG TPA: hypothetical protein VMZ25_10790 [Terriglobales bacterium]|nr:hypothetical protein [Terriglobales bacterium]
MKGSKGTKVRQDQPKWPDISSPLTKLVTMDKAPQSSPKAFPIDRFELLVRSYLDKLVDWEVVHNFAIAHIDDEYLPEFQRPVEDLHLMFLPRFRSDAESYVERTQIKYLLDLLEMLRADVAQYGPEIVRDRELKKMASEDPAKHSARAEHRNRHRRDPRTDSPREDSPQ